MRIGLGEPAVTGLLPVPLNPFDSGRPDSGLPGQRDHRHVRLHLLDHHLPL